jgi:hypothetical protein
MRWLTHGAVENRVPDPVLLFADGVPPGFGAFFVAVEKVVPRTVTTAAKEGNLRQKSGTDEQIIL